MKLSKGYTLVEVLVALALLSIGIAATSVVMVSYSTLQKRAYVQHKAFEAIHNRAEEIKANPDEMYIDSVWVSDEKTRIVLYQQVIDSIAIDSMADLFDWDENEVEKLYRRPQEIRLYAYEHVVTEDSYDDALMDLDIESVDFETLRQVTNIAILTE